MSDHKTGQEHAIQINEETLPRRLLSEDCDMAVSLTEDAEINLVSRASNRIYTLSLDEAQTLATQLLAAVDQGRSITPA